MTRQEVIDKALQDAVPCKCCKNLPKMVVLSGELYYTQCNCKKWKEWPYMFCGLTPKASVGVWNSYQKKNVDTDEFLY